MPFNVRWCVGISPAYIYILKPPYWYHAIMHMPCQTQKTYIAKWSTTLSSHGKEVVVHKGRRMQPSPTRSAKRGVRHVEPMHLQAPKR